MKTLVLDQQARKDYAYSGYHVQRGVFPQDEAAEMIEHYMSLREGRVHPGDASGIPSSKGDQAWTKYPRMINMHDWDTKSAVWMKSPVLSEIAAELLEQDVEILQTMVYFKAAGGRGQAFHQDNLYLPITPIIGAWVALDPADEENGALEIARGSHLLGLLPIQQADPERSVTANTSVVPDYLERETIALGPGDAVFFGGLTVHGSGPNRSRDRFRRAFICHFKGKTTLPILTPQMFPESG